MRGSLKNLLHAMMTFAVFVLIPRSAYAASVDIDVRWDLISIAWAPCAPGEYPCYRYADAYFEQKSANTRDAHTWFGSLPLIPANAAYTPIPAFRSLEIFNSDGNQVLPSPGCAVGNYQYWDTNTQHWRCTILALAPNVTYRMRAKFELTPGVDYHNHLIAIATAPLYPHADPDPHQFDEFSAQIAIVQPGVPKYDLVLNPFSLVWPQCTAQETGGGNCYRTQPMTVRNLQDAAQGANIYCGNTDGYPAFPVIETIERQQTNGTWLSTNCTMVASYTSPTGEVYPTPIYKCPISGTLATSQTGAVRLKFRLTQPPNYHWGTRVICSIAPPNGSADIHSMNNEVPHEFIEFY